MSTRRPLRPGWAIHLYQRGQRFFARRAPWFNYYWCEIMGRPISVRSIPGWDRQALWVGEAGPVRKSWLGALEPEREPDFPQRWRQGARCFAAGHEGICICYLWIMPGPGRLVSGPGFAWDVPAGCIWAFDALSHPLMPGTYPVVQRYAYELMKAEGCHTVLGQVEFGNLSSRRIQVKLGSQPLGRMLSLKLGRRFLHAEWRAHSRRFAWHWHLTPVPLAAFLPPSPPAAAAKARSGA